MVTQSASLTCPEKERLMDCELSIERGRRAFVDVGRALSEIRDSRLYRESFDTFEQYCRHRWGFNRASAYRFIEAWKAVESVSHNVRQPASARVANELAAVPADSRSEVWQEAIDTAPVRGNGEPHITANHVARTADRLSGQEQVDADQLQRLKARIDAFLARVVTPQPARVRRSLIKHIRSKLDDL